MATITKKPSDVSRLNRKLMDENLMLKAQVADQLKLIEKFRSRKAKAHRRLKALRELNKHVELLQTENAYLWERNSRLTSAIVMRPNNPPSLFERIFG